MFSVDPAHGDYFVTFAVETPGVSLPAGQTRQTSTYFSPSGSLAETKDWSEFAQELSRFPSIETLAGILAEIK